MKKIVLAGIAALVLVGACAKKDKVVTRIGSDKITIAMVEERLKEASQGYREYLETSAGKKQFLDLMVRERIVMENAGRAGFKRNKDYTKSLEDFKKEQAKRLRDYEENLLMELYIRDLHEKQIKATDAEVQKYYQDHIKEFQRPVEVKARHILLPTRQEADAALQRVKKGEDFSNVARQISTDPVSASTGGEIGPFRKGDLVPEFEDAVFALKNGQVSGVVETQFGFHVIKKTAEKVLPSKTVEQSEGEIRRIVEKTKFDAWLEGEKKRYNICVDYDMLKYVSAAADAGAQPENNPAEQKPVQEIKK
ncbi:MAG: hypothetical protein A2314_08775 [Elusimicrobia bacterium RIFOXYB2_FULL_50_12]|nr:MAG: hypothetical protein A2314_08775 [Elusimicrobia bacterium RIFOXYB2_FULL_50_12]